MTTQKSNTNRFLSIVIIIVSLFGIAYLTITLGIPLADVTQKLQGKSLNAADVKHEKYIPLKPLPLIYQQLAELSTNRNNETIILGNSEILSENEITNCNITLSNGSKIKDCQITNSVILLNGMFGEINNCLIQQSQILLSSHTKSSITNSQLENITAEITVPQAEILIEKSVVINNSLATLIKAQGESLVKIDQTLFQNNQGLLIATEDKIITDLEGNEITHIPQLQITSSSFIDNLDTPILINIIDRLGTRITSNQFRGGNDDYIKISNSDKSYIVIEKNYFLSHGISINNSSNIIIWANKFENMANYSVKVINSNLVAFQYNTFENVSPAGILTENTPQIELVLNEFINTPQKVKSR